MNFDNLLLLNVRQRLLQQLDDVVVVERVEREAGPARRGRTRRMPRSRRKLVRHRLFADAREKCDVTNAELAPRQRVENANAGLIFPRTRKVSASDPAPRGRHQQPASRLARAEVRCLAGLVGN